MHRLLKRQMARVFPGYEQPPEYLQSFIATVNKTYEEFDSDRKMLDHVLEMNSQELMDSNAEMRLLQAQLRQRNMDLETRLEEIKQMQGSLVQSEKMASIGQLTAGIAHEINNPLAFVSSNLNRFAEYFNEVIELLEEWRSAATAMGNSDERARLQDLASAHEADTDLDFLKTDFSTLMGHTIQGTERMRIIVDRMRVFSHISGETFSEIDLNEAIDETLTIVWNEVKYKAAIVKEYGDAVSVICNPGELKQVLVNLLVNAAQAIEESGTITLRTCDDGANVVIEVCDTGSGIAPEHQKRIFDPFFTTKPVGKGTGLGLWICATIIAKHGGTLSVRSALAMGSTFVITLPKTQLKKSDSSQ
jgi:two-component system, NtrC family, sensor kinase